MTVDFGFSSPQTYGDCEEGTGDGVIAEEKEGRTGVWTQLLPDSVPLPPASLPAGAEPLCLPGTQEEIPLHVHRGHAAFMPFSALILWLHHLFGICLFLSFSGYCVEATRGTTPRNAAKSVFHTQSSWRPGLHVVFGGQVLVTCTHT